MKLVKVVRNIVMIAALVVPLSNCCSAPPADSLNVNLYPQQRDWWCWAAVTEMISEHYGQSVNQCDSANYIYNKDHTDIDCCTGCSGNCPCWGSAWGVSHAELQDNWTHWGFSYNFQDSSLAWDDLKDTLAKTSYCGKDPIEAVIPGHVVVIYGYAEIDGDRYIYIHDPWAPNCEKIAGACSSKSGGNTYVTTYDAFLGQWNSTYYGFSYSAP